MIVIDASALVKYVLHEENWKDISHFIKNRKPIYSLDHIAKEVGNAIWKHCHLHKVINLEEAIKLYNRLMRLFQTRVIIIEREDEYLEAALKIAFRFGVTLYDSLYLVQAQKYGELITSDESQAEIANQLGIRVYLIV
ncbi:MAG: type II toxin-antitoxin system VapC family toxin [archaeon GB-1867-005]|nr:type II toxin-antitoxin system VapC family toxin [Candidatus Culexmicrobium cathedralense]